jgi:uncharacterized protein (TIGR02145 family)
MKYFLLIVALLFSGNSIAQQKKSTGKASVKKTVSKSPTKKVQAKPATVKYGALAIDRSNGFYFGWSNDYATLKEAEERALLECKNKGGNCSVVLTFSGTGCAAYRTVEGGKGTAYGWGIAKTKEEADAIAMRECLKRSGGASPSNFVWSCNSAGSTELKEIYNASGEIISTVKIGSQEWASSNLSVTKFRNGDEIPQAKNAEEYIKAKESQLPVWVYWNFDPKNEKLGKMYNWYALADPRGLAPEGYRLPSKQDWEELINTIGTHSAGKIRSKQGWAQGVQATDDYGFNAEIGGIKSSYDDFDGDESVSYWSNSPSREPYIWFLSIYDFTEEIKMSEYPRTAGMYVRVLKE